VSARGWLRIAIGLAASQVLFANGRALAATCAPPPGAEARLAQIDAAERLRWIENRLDQEARRGRLWARGWAIGIGAGGLASLIAVPFVAPSDRVDWYVGAASAAIGVIPLLVSPLAVIHDAPKLSAAVASTPWNDQAQVCATLLDAEHKLAADAANEHWQQGWWMHAGNLAFNTGVLLFLGLGYGHWTAGLINGGAGVVVGEALILTQPTHLIDELAAYNRGELLLSSQGGTGRGALVFRYLAMF